MGGDPAARRALEEALLEEEGLVDVLEGVALLAHGGGDGLHAHRAAAELLDDGEQDLPVHRVEAGGVDLQALERRGRPPRG